jgi:pimeloyl-ACP methyl ester carboxylesterase
VRNDNALRVWPARTPTRSVVLVLHGGRSRSLEPTTPRQLSYLRMVPIAQAAHREGQDHGSAVWLLRNRVRGWNEPIQDPVVDARWALARIRERHPSSSVVLVGHSMGGRAALRVAGDPGVVGVCALAPWIEPGEPIDQLAGQFVLIAHGDRDRWTDPARSYEYARRVGDVTDRICRFDVRGGGHTMLRRSGDWHGLVRAFVSGATRAAPIHPAIQVAIRATGGEALRRPLPAGLW